MTSESMKLRSGDTILFFSEGVTEAFDEAEDCVGEERLLAHLRDPRALTAAETVQSCTGGREGARTRRKAVRRHFSGRLEMDEC